MRLEFGVQSWCFNKTVDNRQVALKVKGIGLKQIELCGVHVNFQDPSCYADVKAAYEEAGVRIISTGVNKINGDSKDRGLFEFSKAAGCRHMSVNFSIHNIDNELKSAESLAEEFDMKLGIHNHGGYHWLGNQDSIDWVLKKSSPRIGLCLDTAWAMDAKANPAAWVERYAGRVFNVHFKDFTYNRDRSHNDVPVGTGILDLEKLLQALEKTGYNEIAVLEYEGDPVNPEPALKECVAQMKKRM